MNRDLTKHPCFNENVKHRCGRIHLPVAPQCNVRCNFCNRKYDCLNESRPGVISSVLSPGQVLHYLKKMYERDSRLSVVGHASPYGWPRWKGRSPSVIPTMFRQVFMPRERWNTPASGPVEVVAVFPASWHEPITFQIALLRGHQAPAAALVDFLKSAEASALLAQFGFDALERDFAETTLHRGHAVPGTNRPGRPDSV